MKRRASRENAKRRMGGTGITPLEVQGGDRAGVPAPTSRKPRVPGCYQLLIELRRGQRLRIGALGLVRFSSGFYVYTGSAQGGLAGRLGHHLKSAKRPRWHVDYLLRAATLNFVLTLPGRRPLECAWHQRLQELFSAEAGEKEPVPRFGASDCRCTSHLIYFPASPLARLLSLASIMTSRTSAPGSELGG